MSRQVSPHEKVVSKEEIEVLYQDALQKVDAYMACIHCTLVLPKHQPVCPLCKGFRFEEDPEKVTQILQTNIDKLND